MKSLGQVYEDPEHLASFVIGTDNAGRMIVVSIILLDRDSAKVIKIYAFSQKQWKNCDFLILQKIQARHFDIFENFKNAKFSTFENS